jgi:four helix bundle protein
MEPHGFRGLRVWRDAMALVRVCYELTQPFPKRELFGLTSQIRRAATSVPANIAEGNGRFHRGDYLRFISVAHGSLRELETHLLVARELELLNDADLRRALTLSAKTSHELVALARALRS